VSRARVRGYYDCWRSIHELWIQSRVSKDPQYEGVRRINIYLLRLVFILMFFVLGKTTWTHILTHQGQWNPADAIAWCVWTAFATLAALGIIRPLKMLPILLLEIFYKVLWLIIVAYPLWSKGTLAGHQRKALRQRSCG